MKNALRWLLISALIGAFAGSLSAGFLEVLNLVTETRIRDPRLIWFLPLAGFAVGWLYLKFGRSVEAGNNLILDEIHQPKDTVPFRMVPLILLGTWITHLFGGSAGREGTAVQMGASAADQIAVKLKLSKEERTTVLTAGMSAGFGSVFGVPFAGTIFGLEVLAIGGLRPKRVLECLIASFVGHATVLLLGVRHSQYAAPVLPTVDVKVLGSVVFAGLLFGLIALLFSRIIHLTGAQFRRIPYPPLRPFVGGLLVVAGYLAVGTYRYAGLGVDVIQASLLQPLSLTDWLWKSAFTILTLGAGMKGGEVTPLLFIGATFGNCLSHWLPVGFSLLAALGFVGVFAGAANTPLACTLMAMEIFGPGIGLLAAVACFSAWLVSGHRGIYHSQRIARYKPSPFAARIKSNTRHS